MPNASRTARFTAVLFAASIALTACFSAPAAPPEPTPEPRLPLVDGDWVMTRTIVETSSTDPQEAPGTEQVRYLTLTSDDNCSATRCTGQLRSTASLDPGADFSTATFTQTADSLEYTFDPSYANCIDRNTGDVIVADAYAFFFVYTMYTIESDVVDGVDTVTRMEGTLDYAGKANEEAVAAGCPEFSDYWVTADVVIVRAG